MRSTVFSSLAFSLVSLLSGCGPSVYYRPPVEGVVVDERGAPLREVAVEACSEDDAREFKGCYWRDQTFSGTDGTFALDSASELEFLLRPGEGNRPSTLLSACANDGRMGGALVTTEGHDPTPMTSVVISVGDPASFDVDLSRSGHPTRLRDPREAVRRRCAVAPRFKRLPY